MINFDSIDGAIFDVDGTILESMGAWLKMEREYLVQLGMNMTPDLAGKFMVMSRQEISEYLRAEHGIDKPEQVIIDEQNALMEDFYFNEAELKPGVIPLLEGLRLRGIKMCVATATEKYLVDPTLERLNIAQYFGKTFTCGDEQTTKTKPDIYIRAAEFLGTDINRTIVFEDAFHAIKTATAAGFIVAGVYDETAAIHKDDIKQLVDYYLESLENIF